MQKHKILCAGVICALTFTITPTAMATDKVHILPEQDAAAYAAAYANTLNSSYKTALTAKPAADTSANAAAPKDSAATETVQEAHMVATSFDEAGLELVDANSTAELISATQYGEAVTLTVDVTTTAISRLKPGTKASIAENGKITSSWTNRHVLEGSITTGRRNSLNNSQTDSPAFIKDTIIDDEAQPLSASSDVCKTRRKASQDSTKLTYTPTPSQAGGARMSLSKFIQYANKWTSAPYNKDSQDGFNPDFPYNDKGGNCTNFASQTLYAAGMKTTSGTSLETHSTDVWTWNLSGISSASWTWQNADYNYCYLKKHTDFSSEITNIWTAPQGSIMYTDWNKDNTLDHTLLVVDNMVVPAGNGKYKPMPVICQKSSNRNMLPLETWMQYAKTKDHPTFDMYGLTPAKQNTWA